MLLFAFLCRWTDEAPTPGDRWRWHPVEDLGDLEFAPASRPLARLLRRSPALLPDDRESP